VLVRNGLHRLESEGEDVEVLLVEPAEAEVVEVRLVARVAQPDVVARAHLAAERDVGVVAKELDQEASAD